MIRLWINDIELDLSDDFFFPLTYSQADAKSPEKRKRNASKTIKLPGTRVNNAFFSSAYDLNISDVFGDLVGFDFDPTLRYPCRATRHGKPIFRGSSHLQKVVTKKDVTNGRIGFDFDPTLRYPCRATRHGKPIFRGSSHLQKVVTKKDVTNGRINEFEVVLYSELANIFQALGDIKVSELGWSEYDHTLSIANITGSWTAATGSGYWYPLIDYGFTQNQLSYLTNQLRPFVYVTEIVQKCFEHAGNTLSSTFFDSTLIKKLAWGFGGGEPILLDSAEVTARQVNYTGDGSTSYSVNAQFAGINQFVFNNITVIPISTNSIVTLTQVADPTAQMDTATGEIVVANAGYYTLQVDGTFPMTYVYSNPALAGIIIIQVSLRIFVNGALINTFPHIINEVPSGGSTNIVFDHLQELDLSTGDIVKTDIVINTFGSQINDNGGGETLDITFDLNNTLDLDFNAINSGLVDGDTVQIARFLPEMKAADFLRDMITMFNLYVTDPDEDGNVIMLPEKDYFFGTDDVDNWTDKLARDQDIEIQPAANIEGKTYKFRWAEDRDYYKNLYWEQYGIDYGDFDYNVPSTFKKGEKVYQLGMAQTCPVQIEGSDMIIPRIIQLDESTQVVKPHKGKPRIFFNNGVISTTPLLSSFKCRFESL